MRSRHLGALALLALCCLPSCGTTNGVRWAYNMDSIYDEPDELSETCGLRAIVGIPVILGGAVFDIVTFPAQLIFGVWPMWGTASTQMDPNDS